MGHPDPLLEHCRAVLERGSITFARAARLLEPRIREGAWLLYAWGRHVDDTIDGQVLGHGQSPPTPDRQRALLDQLRDRTRRALDGESGDDPPFAALARFSRERGAPAKEAMELLDGMAWDVAGRRCADYSELERYADLVAGSVAAMAGRIMGVPDGARLDRVRRLGIAVQLVNVARDVVDDAGAGRVYLPLDWLAEAGIDPTRVAEPSRREDLVGVVSRVLARADECARALDDGIGPIPFRSAWAMVTGVRIYTEIGREIRRRGPRAWDHRATVGAGRRIGWVIRSLGPALTLARG